MTRFPLVLDAEGLLVDHVDCMGGTLKLASESMPTLQRWKYIAEQNLKPKASEHAHLTYLFVRTIIADKDH